MAAAQFRRYELRTVDLPAAQKFYEEVLGPAAWGSGLSLAPLPERARLAGAPPHWLGHIGVGEVEATASRILALGGQQLGPLERSMDGGASRVVLREGFGAVLALTRAEAPAQAGVTWHVLNTHDHAQAFAAYSQWFGWSATEIVDLGHGLGESQSFAWDESGQSVGSVTSTARLPGVHPHWLFCFPVADLEAALARVRERGGTTLPAVRTPRGALLAACDDPQGAAFGLYEGAR